MKNGRKGGRGNSEATRNTVDGLRAPDQDPKLKL